jgi:hypothetical protein
MKPSGWILFCAIYLLWSNFLEAIVFAWSIFDTTPIRDFVFMIKYGLTVILPIAAGLLLLFQKREGFWLLIFYLVFRAVTLVSLTGSEPVYTFLLLYFYGEIFVFITAFVLWVNRHRLEPLWSKKPLGVTEDA